MRSVVTVVRTVIGIDELLLAAGLALVTYGLWAMVGRAACVAPGVVLVWIALPPRRPFLPRSESVAVMRKP